MVYKFLKKFFNAGIPKNLFRESTLRQNIEK